MKEGIEQPKTKEERITELKTRYVSLYNEIVNLDQCLTEEADEIWDEKDMEAFNEIAEEKEEKEKELEEIKEKLMKEGYDTSKIEQLEQKIDVIKQLERLEREIRAVKRQIITTKSITFLPKKEIQKEVDRLTEITEKQIEERNKIKEQIEKEGFDIAKLEGFDISET